MKLPPDLEKDILIALLRDHKLLVWATGRLKPEDFTNEVYGEVWYMMRRLWSAYSERITYNALRHEVEAAIKSQEFLPEDVPVLVSLFKAFKNQEIMQDWTKDRLQKWLEKKAHQSHAAEVNKALMDGRTDVIHDSYRELQKRISRSDNTEDIMDQEVWLDVIRRASDKEGRVISCGEAHLDALFGGGLFKGEFGIVFGPQGVGKSFFGVQAGFGSWVSGHRTLHVSNEDTIESIRERYITKLTSTPRYDMETLQDNLLEQRKRDEESLRGMLKIQYVDPGDPPDVVAGLLEEARVDEEPFEVVIVDYLDQFRLRSSNSKPLWEMLMDLSSEFSRLAKEYDVCILAISHSDSKGYGKRYLSSQHMGLSKMGKNKVADFVVGMGQGPTDAEKGLVFFQVVKLRKRKVTRPKLVCEQRYETASFIPKEFAEIEDE